MTLASARADVAIKNLYKKDVTVGDFSGDVKWSSTDKITVPAPGDDGQADDKTVKTKVCI